MSYSVLRCGCKVNHRDGVLRPCPDHWEPLDLTEGAVWDPDRQRYVSDRVLEVSQ